MHVGPRSNTPEDLGMFSYITNDVRVLFLALVTHVLRCRHLTTKYLNAQDLANIINSDKMPRKDYLVVDVRDDDFGGGNIAGAHNEPSSTFLAKVDKLVEDTKDVKTVIFHCMLSQQRGPKAARVWVQQPPLHCEWFRV